ncbi:30S ribosomal protein S6 [Rhodoligotrophos ferricapiens]|uniref:30S ribosomal protein S6 n=1 Tax=Rhodoligotrophos ferricapiens TaxID=3069264 RepID=UPI00315CD811
MALYEHIFMVRQDASNAQVEALTEQFKTVIQENGGSVGKVEYWGLRPVAYRIKKNRKAHYTLMNIEAPHAAVAEMERQMKINEDIVRFLTLKVDEHETGPSAMMRARSSRDDRDERGPRGGRGGRDGGFRDGPRPRGRDGVESGRSREEAL